VPLADRAVIVADIGKTHAKLTLWRAGGALLARETRPNTVGQGVLDADGIGAWMKGVIRQFGTLAKVGAIIPVAHGAAVAAIRDGQLAFAPVDYEAPIPEDIMAAYRAQRPPFAETGSPALPQGLNLGAQLHALGDRIDGATLVPWPQYWAWFLSGVAVSEVTSLGCHTDLWNPATGDFSTMAKRRGWATQFAPIAKAGDVIGMLKPGFGLGDDVEVHVGVHDSNAALVAARAFPEMAGEATVLSTGTWFVAMRTPEVPVALESLPEARDCLANVDVTGRMIPSARWMGGREIELLGARIDRSEDQAAIRAAINLDAMILPGFAPGCGPFPSRTGDWLNAPDDPIACAAAVCLYAAMMTHTLLGLIGARRALLVEGRFASSEVFVRALATVRPNDAIYVADADNDVSLGALRLVDPTLKPNGTLTRVAPLELDLTTYHARWLERAAA
jgi:sugar (pentulose or hexulose) kinase